VIFLPPRLSLSKNMGPVCVTSPQDKQAGAQIFWDPDGFSEAEPFAPSRIVEKQGPSLKNPRKGNHMIRKNPHSYNDRRRFLLATALQHGGRAPARTWSSAGKAVTNAAIRRQNKRWTNVIRASSCPHYVLSFCGSVNQIPDDRNFVIESSAETANSSCDPISGGVVEHRRNRKKAPTIA